MFQAWNFSEWRGRNAGIFGAIFDLLPLAVFDRPVLELGRFAIDPLQGNFRGNSDIFRLAWGVVTQLVDQNNVSFLFGCSSFKGTRPAAHGAAFRYLYRNNHIAPSRWRFFLWRLSFG